MNYLNSNYWGIVEVFRGRDVVNLMLGEIQSS